MSTRTPKKSTVRQVIPNGSGVRWKTVPITSTDAIQFAAELETSLNDLMKDGWALTGMMERGDATILTAQRTEPSPEALARSRAETLPDLESAVLVRSVKEYVYTFLHENEQLQSTFASMEEAIASVRADLKKDDILPLSIAHVCVTTYDPLRLVSESNSSRTNA